MQRHLRAPLLALVFALTGCVNEIQSSMEAEHDDHAYEMLLSVDELASWATEGDWLVSPPLEIEEGASRVGALVALGAAGTAPAMEARALEGGAPVGDWIPLATTWSEEDQHVAIAELGSIAGGAQLRIRIADASEIQILRWTAAIPEPLVEAPADEVAGRSEALRAELRGLGITSREEWGARATRCTSTNSSKSRMAIHHTVTSSTDPARQMRGIQVFHMDTRGWCDVGYHFLIGRDGQIFEGRPVHLLGAHVGSHNTGNIGISFIGCFHTSGCSSLGPSTPPDAAVRAAGRLVGTLSRLYGITVDATNVKGHRDHSGQSTSCPGDNLHSRLGTIRTIGRTETLSGSTSPAPPPPPPPAPAPSTGASCTHSYGGTYGHLACSASYQCCNGSWRDRASGCGTCACTETSGSIGCTAPSGPPAGASCTHTYGGRYANTACSASYQCCNGSWRSRTAGCGACFCTETTGERGCGL